jgi:3-carboxy-cis,cis-muconate cycloisomerase
VDADRMRANLDLTHGLIMAEALTMALAQRLGRPEAYTIVQRLSDRAAQTGMHLRELAAGDDQVRTALGLERLQQVFDVANYLGANDAFIDRALLAFRSLRPEASTR